MDKDNDPKIDDISEKSMMDRLKAFINKLTYDRPTQIITAIIFIVMGIVAMFVLNALDKPKGSWKFGACKLIIEEIVEYPHTVDVLAAGEKRGSSTIYFSKHNSFGNERLHLIFCEFDRDDQGIYIKNVTLDNRPLDPIVVKRVSDNLKYILAQPEVFDTVLPEGYTSRLSDFKNRTKNPIDKAYK